MSKLAINGGKKAVTIKAKERWKNIRKEEIWTVIKMLRREEISRPGGGVMEEFEQDFAKYVGAKYALSQCNGTSTLHAAYFAAGVSIGDEVIVPTYTWHATATTILHAGGTPVFCEIDPRTLTADPEDIKRNITPRTKAIAVTHIWGNVAKMDAIMEIAQEHNLKVIEDASHAHGAEYNGKKVGTIGDIGCFSLQANKAVKAGEGAVVVTDNPEYYDRILILGHYGRILKDRLTDKYDFLGDMGLGWKYRAHPIAIGIAKVQLTRLDELNAKRAKNFEYLDKGLNNIPGVEPISTYPLAKRGGLIGYRIIYHPERFGDIPLKKFIEALRAEGVPVSAEVYPILHLEPLFSGNDKHPYGFPHVLNARTYRKGDLPVSEDVYSRLIALRVFTEPPNGLLKQYIDAFQKVVENIGELV